MNENHGNPFAIVELKLIKPGMTQMLSRKNKARDIERTVRRAGERERDRRGKIRRQRKLPACYIDIASFESVVKA